MVSRNRVIVAALTSALLVQSPAVAQQEPPPAGEQPAQPQPAQPQPAQPQPAQPQPVPAQPAPQAQPQGPRPSERPWSDEELKEIEEIERDTDIYAGAQEEHQARLKVLLKREYDQRLAEINKKYKQSCLSSHADFKAKRAKSQKLLEDFRARYPNDPAWTPDVLFRLAKLYYYQINTEWNERTEPPCAALSPPVFAEPQDGSTTDGQDAAPLGPDYGPALALWREIVQKWPEYRLIDGTLYLLAYVTGESPPFGMGKPDEARPIWLGLVCKNKYDPLAVPPPVDPKAPQPQCPQPDAKLLENDPYAGCEPYKPGSKLVDEAWVRIGDAHFNARCELPQAIAAYRQVTKNEASEYYDNALYMLAWSYYRFNQYEDAIQTFDKFVVLSDKKEEESAGEGFELRKEAVQYLAISFADPRPPETLSNPVKAVERINAFYKGRQNEKHVRDVYEELGNVIKTNAGSPPPDGPVPDEQYTAYEKAIEVWMFALDNWPTHPRNPLIHQQIVELYEWMGLKDKEVQERARIAELYKKGSDWYRANEMNREAMDWANSLSENSLIKAAVQVHRQAQEARQAWEQGKTEDQILKMQDDPGRKAYQALYAQAAQLYEQYLVTYPTSTNLYEFSYRLGDCYFYTDNFDKAVEQYRWVRDHSNMGTKYKTNSIKRIVEARRTAIDLALNKNPPTLVTPKDPTPETIKANPNPEPVPELWRELQEAFDEYAKWVPDDPDASKMALEGALISYKHLQLDAALGRFNFVFEKFCHTPEATNAKDGMLVIYQARGETDKFEALNQKFIDRKCGSLTDQQIADDQNKALRYRKAKEKYDKADALEKQGQNAQALFLESGQEFYAYYLSVKVDNPDRDDALFGAAVAYSRGGRPKTAISLYQLFLDDKSFKSSEYYVEAAFLIAQNYKNAFEYEKAADMFLVVYKMAGEPGRKSQKSFDLKQARLNSLYNAAYLREVDRTYNDRSRTDLGAISLYKQYAKEEPDKKKAADAYFRIAMIYKKIGKSNDMLATFDTWRKTYAKDPTIAPNICTNYVMSYYETARLKKTAKDQKKAWNDTIVAFDRCFSDAIAARQTTKEAQEEYGRGEILAREWAGEGQFRLADFYYKENFEPFKFKWPAINLKKPDPKKIQKDIDAAYKRLGDVHEATIREFLKVARFQSTWNLAALVRIGDVSYFAADKVFAAGVPPEFVKFDTQNGTDLSGEFTTTIETKMRDEFVDPQDAKKFPFGAKQYWQMTLESAKKNGISNEWSKLAEQRLNTYIASDLFPVQRDDITDPVSKP
jgi:tetratricopeptide (TPR) repeat protein